MFEISDLIVEISDLRFEIWDLDVALLAMRDNLVY